ncbi:hypothetical protein ACHAXR_000322, partial [Thalassiosira sp. AJA248-18]
VLLKLTALALVATTSCASAHESQASAEESEMPRLRGALPSHVDAHELGGTEAYPAVTVLNDTPYKFTGEVQYASFFCRNDDFEVGPHQTWRGPSRGVCLITKIKGYVIHDGEDYTATPYRSSGTSYSKFEVECRSNGDGSCSLVVDRIVTGDEDSHEDQPSMRGSVVVPVSKTLHHLSFLAVLDSAARCAES